MFRPQFSMAGLLGAVTFVAVACAALAKPSEPWASILVTATVVAIGAAALSAWFRRGPRRSFAAGFAVVGATYLWLVFGQALSTTIGARLLTTRALVYAESKWRGEVSININAFPYPLNTSVSATADYDADGFVDLVVGNPPTLYTNNGNGTFMAVSSKTLTPPSPFYAIGQSLWTWILAAAGGWVAAHWHARRVGTADQCLGTKRRSLQEL